jgi:hypothetical protein
MSVEPDIEIRLNASWGLTPTFFGLVFGGFGLYLMSQPQQFGGGRTETLFGGLICLLIGIGFIAWACSWFSDKRVKLLISAEGIRDTRTGEFVRWHDFRGVRLYVETTNASQSLAIMYIKVPAAGGFREISFDVNTLDRSPRAIADVVQRRGLAIVEPLSPTKEIIAVLLAEIHADLVVGRSLTYAVNKLVERGLSSPLASEIVKLVSAGKTASCPRCDLTFVDPVQSCSGCGSKLSCENRDS